MDRKKVCIVVPSLTRGGLERSTGQLSVMLSEAGMDVHIILLINKIDYPYAGTLYNLGEAKQSGAFARFKRFWQLRRYLHRHRFDTIIDVRTRKEPLVEWLYLWAYRSFRTIYMVHSNKTDNYLTNNGLIARNIIKKVDSVVCVADAITQRLKQEFGTNNILTIYNAIPQINRCEAEEQDVKLPPRYILFLGRIDDNSKNLRMLIEAYRLSSLAEQNIKLLIVGDGEDKAAILHEIEALGESQNILMHPFASNVYPYLRNALFVTLTSRYEGFPMIIIEALSVGTPVVSADCETGPRELIRHTENGLLVQQYTPQAIADAFNKMATDTTLLKHCKENATRSVQHLSADSICQQWLNLLQG